MLFLSRFSPFSGHYVLAWDIVLLGGAPLSRQDDLTAAYQTLSEASHTDIPMFPTQPFPLSGNYSTREAGKEGLGTWKVAVKPPAGTE